jgi:hypothetical protein
MPKQTSGITITDSGAMVAVNTPWGASFEVAKDDLLDRSFDAAHIKQNIRLASLIGNYSDPRSQEFRDFVNRSSGGLKCKDGKWFIGSITFDGSTYKISIGNVDGDAPTQVEATKEELTSDFGDFRAAVIANLAVWMRIEEEQGKPSRDSNGAFTAALNTRLAKAKFWY